MAVLTNPEYILTIERTLEPDQTNIVATNKIYKREAYTTQALALTGLSQYLESNGEAMLDDVYYTISIKKVGGDT